MADVAVLSVIFTGTVGIVGAGVAALGHFVSLTNEDRKRLEARRDDLRTVMDDAAKALMAAGAAFGRLAANDTTQWGDLLVGAATDAQAQLARLGVRLGPDSDAVTKYEAAADTLWRMLALTEDSSDLEQTQRAVAPFRKRLSEEINEFCRAASAIAGADVSPHVAEGSSRALEY